MAPRTTRWILPRAALAVVAALALGGCVGPAGVSRNPDTTQARRQLGELSVASARSMSGYSRERFSHWRSDGGGSCDVRDTVLRRDGQDVKLRDGCNVVGGRWFSVYDERWLTDPAQVDIDHMVPLANAWRSGAGEWTDAQRGDFANDLVRPELIAVSATSNRAKGDQDPSQWRPPSRSYWCHYAQQWIAVKHHWRLSVTSAEKAALSEMLGTCPNTSAPRTSQPARAG